MTTEPNDGTWEIPGPVMRYPTIYQLETERDSFLSILNNLIEELRCGHQIYGGRLPLWAQQSIDIAENLLKDIIAEGNQ